MFKNLALFLALAAVLVGAPASAEIVSSSDTHFVLRHEATSPLPADQLWARLIEPQTWWHPDHTYSGDANNLSLDLQAGGLWREDWQDNSVAHGEVLFVDAGRVLRLNAPFGPLQGLGAYTIWTITITPQDNGSTIVFDEISSGPATADMAEIAKAVDYVKGEAIRRLSLAGN